MHGRSRMGMDPRMPTMPGRSTSGIHRSGRYCLQLSLGEGNKPKKGIYTFLESDGVQRTLQALKKLCTHSSTFLFAPSKPKPRKIKIIQVCIPFRSVTAPADARVRKTREGTRTRSAVPFLFAPSNLKSRKICIYICTWYISYIPFGSVTASGGRFSQENKRRVLVQVQQYPGTFFWRRRNQKLAFARNTYDLTSLQGYTRR